ncbi:MAG TPA: FAD:protein FMN transferase [bacterium]
MTDAAARVKRAQLLFGTLCAVEVGGGDRAAVQAAAGEALAELRRVHRLLSPFDPESELSRLNWAAGGGPVRVSSELFGLIQSAARMSARTGGRFDPVTWPLLTLWRACEAAGRWPTEEERLAAVSASGCRLMRLDAARGTVELLDARAAADLSSLSKGYAMDCALRAARRRPVESVLINAGGQMLAWRADGHAIDAGLADPEERGGVIGLLRLSNQSVATSGQQEPHLTIEGKVVGHIFDPATGWPMQTALRSVSVAAPAALTADLLATAVFTVGVEAGLRLVAEEAGASCLAMSADTEFGWVMSGGFPLTERLRALEVA